MNAGRSSDVLALAGAALLVGLLTITRNGPSWLAALHPALAPAGSLTGALASLGVMTTLGVLAACRARLVRRTLASRRRWLLLPADPFDPPADAVGRFAAQLARTQRRGLGWLDRPASGVRLRVDGQRGAMAYSVETVERAAPVLRAAVGTYHGVELRDPQEPGDEDGNG